MILSDKQKREIEYHRKYAQLHKGILEKPFSYEVITSNNRRWQNAYWNMYTFLRKQQFKDKNVLIVGCGFGDDALRLAKMGANVYAFDLSQESLEIAKQLACREKLNIDFRKIPAEKLDYESDFFDCVIVTDILHHVEIKKTMNEISRVSKNGAVFALNEIYTHSMLDKIRHSYLVEKKLYPKMQNYIHRGNIYITKDERKLNQCDMAFITGFLSNTIIKYFSFFVARIVPDKYNILSRLDRLLLIAMGPAAYLFAGRVLITARIKK